LSRRRFLAGCAACAAGVGGLTTLSSGFAQAGGDAAKPRIRLVFSHTTPDQIGWPNIGYDYEGEKKRFARLLAEQCPDIEFLPIWVRTAEDVEKVMAGDSQVDGYLLYLVGHLVRSDGGQPMLSRLGKAGRPTVLVDNLFAASAQFLFGNVDARRKGWPVIGVATSRFEDIAEAVRCFHILKKPGATVNDFAEAAEAVRKKNIAAMGDMTCAEDVVQLNDIRECTEKLRSSTILLVGREAGRQGQAIEKVFGTKVVAIQFPKLHDAYLRADQAEASQWADKWIGAAEKVIEPTREEIVKSGAMYLAMQELMGKHNARAIAINCLGGFYGGHLQGYPCLGFCQFNNDGLVGACEGDLMSTISMVTLACLAGRPGFISDPVFDTSKNQVIYAHCVAPTKVFGPEGTSNPFHIRSHSEDRREAALRSLMPLGYMTTTLKFIPYGREPVAIIHQGKSVDNIDDDKACRTKLAVDLKGDIDKLLTGWGYGWHRVTFYGDLKEPVAELCKTLGVKLIEEA